MSRGRHVQSSEVLVFTGSLEPEHACGVSWHGRTSAGPAALAPVLVRLLVLPASCLTLVLGGSTEVNFSSSPLQSLILLLAFLPHGVHVRVTVEIYKDLLNSSKHDECLFLKSHSFNHLQCFSDSIPSWDLVPPEFITISLFQWLDCTCKPTNL